MKTLMSNATVIAAISLLTGLGACSGQAEGPRSAKGVDQGFVSAGKATAAVSVTHSFSATPEVGQLLELQLVLAAAGDEPLQLDINADDALAATPWIGRSVRPGERVVIDMVPQAEGRYYINVIAWVGAGDRAQARVVSIPVQVGKGSYKANGEKATIGPDGERLIRMSAEEKTES